MTTVKRVACQQDCELAFPADSGNNGGIAEKSGDQIVCVHWVNELISSRWTFRRWVLLTSASVLERTDEKQLTVAFDMGLK